MGRANPFGPKGILSGIDKHPVSEPIELTETGLVGDEQGDRRHHGGVEKALHHYPFEHYDSWRLDVPEIGAKLAASAAFGENLSTIGLTEKEVCLGDRFSLGHAVVEVSQGRQPCWRLNVRFSRPDIARRVQETGRTGWYYRVLEGGFIEPGQSLRLIDRPHPEWPLNRVLDLLYRNTLDLSSLKALADMACLAPSWRELFRRRLTARSVESWSSRLDTPLA